MKRFLGLCVFAAIVGNVAEARSIAEIAKSKELHVGMRDRDLVYHAAGAKQLHTLVAEKFAEYVGKKSSAAVTSKIVVSKDMANFWANDKGEVKQGEEYTPKFFSQVDVYTDVLTVNAWRQKLATPIPFLPIKESFLCNFKAGKMTFARAKAEKVKLITVKASSFHTLITKAGFSDSELVFAGDTGELIPKVEGTSGNACTLLDSDFALFKSKSSKATFAGAAGDTTQALAWWVAKDNKPLADLAQAFWKEFQKSPEWTKLFKESYGMEFSDYLNTVGSL
jgi:hypothetical protein